MPKVRQTIIPFHTLHCLNCTAMYCKNVMTHGLDGVVVVVVIIPTQFNCIELNWVLALRYHIVQLEDFQVENP